MMSYYRTNVGFMYRVDGDFSQYFTLSEVEDMIPFERSAYLMLMKEKIELHESTKGKK